MITDIEGREILVGDECYMPSSNTQLLIKITKETPKCIRYTWKSIKTNDWHIWDTYMMKSGLPAQNLIKKC